MNQGKIQNIPFVKDAGIFYNSNFARYYPKGIHSKSLPPSYIMGAAISSLHLGAYLVDRAVEIQNRLGVGTTLWSLRFENGGFSLEFYFYYNKTILQHSFENLISLFTPYMDIPLAKKKVSDGYVCISYNLESPKIEGLNIYYAPVDLSRPVVVEEETGWQYNQRVNIGTSYYFTPEHPELIKKNTYYLYTNCIRDLYDIMEQVYNCCRELFPSEDPILANKFLSLPYIYDEDRNRYFHPYCLGKKEGAMCVYFIGFSINQYLTFLKYHQYPETYIQTIERDKENLSHLQFDIGIDFCLKDGQFVIKKTVYFGSF